MHVIINEHWTSIRCNSKQCPPEGHVAHPLLLDDGHGAHLEELHDVVEEGEDDDADNVNQSLMLPHLLWQYKYFLCNQQIFLKLTQLFLKGLQMWKYLSRATATTLYTLPGNGGRSLLIVYLYHFHRKLHSFTFIHSTACLKHFSSLSAIQLSAKVFLKVTDSALQTAVRNKIIFDLFLISRS